MQIPPLSRRGLGRWLAAGAALAAGTSRAADLPLFDAHIHYSHDAWTVVPPAQVVDILKKAGVKRAMVSSSNNDGTRMLQDVAPGLIVPELRPYRSRGEISTTWPMASMASSTGRPRREGVISSV